VVFQANRSVIVRLGGRNGESRERHPQERKR
jgi:hypothetical protein